MVCGCVSALGKGNLHFCAGTISAEKYIEILEQYMLPSRRHLFQGCPCITTFRTHYKGMAAEDEAVRLLDWSAYNPDLSPVENVWRYFEHYLLHT